MSQFDPLRESARLAFEKRCLRARDLYCAAMRQYIAFFGGYDPSTYGTYRMPRWDGGKDNLGRVHKAIWPQIVRRADELGYDLDQVIETAFYVFDKGKPPYPTQLFAQPVLERLHSERHLAEEKIRSTALIGLRNLMVEYMVLKDNQPDEPLVRLLHSAISRLKGRSPIICYIVAYHLGCRPIAEFYAGKAAQEYRRHSDTWDHALQIYWPHGFREAVLMSAAPPLPEA